MKIYRAVYMIDGETLVTKWTTDLGALEQILRGVTTRVWIETRGF